MNTFIQDYRTQHGNPVMQPSLFAVQRTVPFPAPEHPKFTFIDLFAGIGGFRLAMQRLGGKCVYSSEWDKQAQKTYFANVIAYMKLVLLQLVVCFVTQKYTSLFQILFIFYSVKK